MMQQGAPQLPPSCDYAGQPTMSRVASLALCLAWLLTCLCAPASASAEPVADVVQNVPNSLTEFSPAQAERLRKAATALDDWAAQQLWPSEGYKPEDVLACVRRVVEAKAQVDGALERALKLRSQFAAQAATDDRRKAICQYLQTTSHLIDLSGRLRFLLQDLLDAATDDLDPYPAQFRSLLQLLTEKRVSAAATALAYMLFDPSPEFGAKPFPSEDRGRALNLITAARQAESVETLAAYVRHEKNPDLVVYACEIIRYLGLPQKPRPGSDPNLPEPPILAEELSAILKRLDASKLSPTRATRRIELQAWLAERSARGVTGETYRLGEIDVRAGDWLLMRNPSPYNLFTDLAPGLFTHVGVVAVEKGGDGIRRFVIVDLPERGPTIPATTVDAYVKRTLHYFVLRHAEPAIAAKLGQAAADLIGSEAQFDLTFRTSRVTSLRGQPLKGATVHTYCAGFLLLCAQATGLPREEFFPITESPAAGKTVKNLETLGISLGADFVSPTGAIFAPHLNLVGRCESTYDPGREIQETLYDHFASGCMRRTLKPSADVYQALRLKLAELAKTNRWVARTLAKAHNVSERTDLEAAAKAAAVVEALDALAERNLAEYADAHQAITAGPGRRGPLDRRRSEEIQEAAAYRQRHAQLANAWDAGQLTPRELRIKLVQYYSDRGRRQVDERFFR